MYPHYTTITLQRVDLPDLKTSTILKLVVVCLSVDIHHTRQFQDADFSAGQSGMAWYDNGGKNVVTLGINNPVYMRPVHASKVGGKAVLRQGILMGSQDGQTARLPTQVTVQPPT